MIYVCLMDVSTIQFEFFKLFRQRKFISAYFDSSHLSLTFCFLLWNGAKVKATDWILFESEQNHSS